MVTRNSQATRDKILAAATAAFVDQGLAGARVDAIAADAGVNKRMLYHHFGDKQALFAAVLKQKLESLAGAPSANEEEVPVSITPDQARLLAWEGLAAGSVAAPDADIAPLAEADQIPLDARVLRLAQLALHVLPIICGPQVRRLTGRAADDPELVEAAKRLQGVLAQRLAEVTAAQHQLAALREPRSNRINNISTKAKIRLRATSKPHREAS